MTLLQEKVKRSFSRLKRLQKAGGVYIGHSGGKDSCVVTWLADAVFEKELPIVHNPKASVSPEDRRFLYELAMKRQVILQPVDQMEGNPAFKYQVDGTRRAEAERIDGKSNVYMEDGVEKLRTNMPWFVEEGRFGIGMIYPIFDWTDDEVWHFIKWNEIEVSRSYGEKVRNFGSTY